MKTVLKVSIITIGLKDFRWFLSFLLGFHLNRFILQIRRRAPKHIPPNVVANTLTYPKYCNIYFPACADGGVANNVTKESIPNLKARSSGAEMSDKKAFTDKDHAAIPPARFFGMYESSNHSFGESK